MAGWMEGGMGAWVDGRMDGWMEGWVGGGVDGWMDKREDGQIDGRMDEWMADITIINIPTAYYKVVIRVIVKL
jgi:hypothetical protein